MHVFARQCLFHKGNKILVNKNWLSLLPIILNSWLRGYCLSHRLTNLRGKCSLFFKIEAALQYEHQRVEVHCGLKSFLEGQGMRVSNIPTHHDADLLITAERRIEFRDCRCGFCSSSGAGRAGAFIHFQSDEN